jgi:predicted XRE-type DNA-binding protein
MPRKDSSVSLTNGSDDEVLEALSALTVALEVASVDQQAMADEAIRMRSARSWRESWLSALPAAGQPNLVSLSTQALSGLSVATSRVRTSLARALRAEGLTVREIAALFGVSHQRVSELLARTARPAGTDAVPEPAVALNREGTAATS